MDEQFKSWLIENKQLNPRSASDVLCRIKRVNLLTPISLDMPNHKILYDLSCHHEFINFTTSVKSQLKRSVNLYYEFVSLKHNI